MHAKMNELLSLKFYKKRKGNAKWVARKGRRKIGDSICGRYTNACKLKSPIFFNKELYKLITIILVF
jgi:hypothetical protein